MPKLSEITNTPWVQSAAKIVVSAVLSAIVTSAALGWKSREWLEQHDQTLKDELRRERQEVLAHYLTRDQYLSDRARDVERLADKIDALRDLVRGR